MARKKKISLEEFSNLNEELEKDSMGLEQLSVFADPAPQPPVDVKEPRVIDKIDSDRVVLHPVGISGTIVDPPPIPPEPGITMNEYLCNYFAKRSLDGVFTKWFKKKDPTNPLKPIKEWDELINKFLNEVA